MKLYFLYVFLIGTLLPVAAQDRATGGVPILPSAFETIEKAPPIPGAPVGEPKVTFRKRLPVPVDQGKQKCCTSVSISYLKYFHERTENESFDARFSPAFIHNAFVVGDATKGVYIQNALTYLTGGGCCTLPLMPWSENDCTTQASKAARQEAALKDNGTYRIEGWEAVDIDAKRVRERIASSQPMLIGAYVDVKNNGTWHKDAKGVTQAYLTSSVVREYHAMLVVGYDDDKEAFEVINSWGPQWNDDGYGWIGYDFWPSFVREAYVATDRKTNNTLTLAADGTKVPQWVPVGNMGLTGGNRGFPEEVSLQKIELTKDKRLPEMLREHASALFPGSP